MGRLSRLLGIEKPLPKRLFVTPELHEGDARPEFEMSEVEALPSCISTYVRHELNANIKNFDRVKADRIIYKKLPSLGWVTTYVVVAEERRPTMTERWVQVFDVGRFNNRQGGYDAVIGCSQLEYMLKPGMVGNPLRIKQKETSAPWFEGLGLGQRRLILLDQMCQNEWGVPANSTLSAQYSEALKPWNALVRKGWAFWDGSIYRFYPRQRASQKSDSQIG